MTTEKFESLCYIQTSFLPSDLITVKLVIENAIQYCGSPSFKQVGI